MSKSLYSLIKLHYKKVQAYQKFYVDFVPRGPSFIKNKTPAWVFFWEFWETFQHAGCSFAKNNSGTVIFLMNLQNLWKHFFCRLSARAASSDISIARFFCKDSCLLKWKIKGYQRNYFLKMSIIPYSYFKRV